MGYRKHDCYIVVVNAWYNMTCLWILLNRPALPDFNSSQSWALDFVPCADYFLFFVRSIDPPTTPNQFPAEFSLDSEIVLVLLSWVSYYPSISQPSFDCALYSYYTFIMLNGLDSIAMAVAHLENKRQEEEEEGEREEARQVTASSFARGSSSESSSPQLTVNGNGHQQPNNPTPQNMVLPARPPPVPLPRSFPASNTAASASKASTTSIHPLAQAATHSYHHQQHHQTVPTAVSQSPESVPVHPTAAAAAAGWSQQEQQQPSQTHPSSSSDTTASAGQADHSHHHRHQHHHRPLGVTPEGEIILEELKTLLQQQQQQPSSPSSETTSSTDDHHTTSTTTTAVSSHALQPDDVLCGRGGETNHHSGKY